MNKYRIGLDIGTHTGIAVYDVTNRKLIEVETMDIDNAYTTVLKYSDNPLNNVTVYIEDVTKIGGGKSMVQGAGSIKRDYRIWINRFEKHGIKYESFRPKKNRSPLFKCTSDYFKIQTGWDKRTSEHARDAVAMIWW